MHDFKFVFLMEPIDYWYGALIADEAETANILRQMPEESRDNIVYKIYMPYGIQLEPIFLCKADNNGTVYVFSDFDFVSAYNFIFYRK